jgi:hypothetical protein
MAEGGSGVDGSKWQRRNKNECGAVVMNPFFCPGFARGILFFARGFAHGSRQNKSLTNKIRADLPAGKKKDSITNTYNNTRVVSIWYFWLVFGWYFLVFTKPIPEENLFGTFWYCYFGGNPFFP